MSEESKHNWHEASTNEVYCTKCRLEFLDWLDDPTPCVKEPIIFASDDLTEY